MCMYVRLYQLLYGMHDCVHLFMCHAYPHMPHVQHEQEGKWTGSTVRRGLCAICRSDLTIAAGTMSDYVCHV